MAEEEGGMNGESEDSSENESEDSEDNFIDNEEITEKKSDYEHAKRLEIETNKQKIMTHLESLPLDEMVKIGLIFCYSNKSDIFK